MHHHEIGDSPSKAQLFRGNGIYHHMFDGRQVGRKRHVKVIHAGIDKEPGPFPGEVMVMGNGRNTCFGYELGQGHAQGEVHRYGKGVFRDNQVDIESLYVFVQRLLELLLYFMGELRCLSFSLPPAEQIAVDLLDQGRLEVSLLHQK